MSKETFHTNNKRTGREVSRWPTNSNPLKEFKSTLFRTNNFKHVVQGSSLINHDTDDLRCKVPVSFKYLTPPTKSPTETVKSSKPSGKASSTPSCDTPTNQEPRRVLRKAFNTPSTFHSSSLKTGSTAPVQSSLINNNHISKFKSGASDLQSPISFRSSSPVLNINKSFELCQKCHKQVSLTCYNDVDITNLLQVYQAERIRAAGGTWHVSCFTCRACSRRLDSGRLCERAGQVYILF